MSLVIFVIICCLMLYFCYYIEALLVQVNEFNRRKTFNNFNLLNYFIIKGSMQAIQGGLFR